MRLIEVARKLGMTGQELRRELKEVDFGVKSTDREISDRIAQGIIRYVATKHGITVKEDESESGEMEVVTSGGEKAEEAEEAEADVVVVLSVFVFAVARFISSRSSS